MSVLAASTIANRMYAQGSGFFDDLVHQLRTVEAHGKFTQKRCNVMRPRTHENDFDVLEYD